MLETIEIYKKDVFIEEWEQALKELKKGDEYMITADGSWIEWRGEFIDTLVMSGDFIVAIRKAKKIPFPSNDDLANAFRSVGKSMCRNGLNVSENKEADKKMIINIKIGVTPEQFAKIQEICFQNLFIRTNGTCEENELCSSEESETIREALGALSAYDFNDFEFAEVEDNPFIHTNGTCEEEEVTEPQGETEQAHRQAGSKPPQYQIGIDTFERSKANQMAETRVEIAKFMIDKYNWRNKGQDIEDFQKIKDYCDFAIEALNEIKG